MPMRTWKGVQKTSVTPRPATGKPNEMEGERAHDRRRREKAIEACAGHFDDLKEAYPKGVPIAKDRKAQFTWQVPIIASHLPNEALRGAVIANRTVLTRPKRKWRPKDETMAQKREWNASQKRWLVVPVVKQEE